MQNKLVISAIICGLTIFALAGCSSSPALSAKPATTSAPVVAAPTPSSTPMAAPTSSPVMTPGLIAGEYKVSGGTFTPCDGWFTAVGPDAGDHAVWTRGDFCSVLPPHTSFKTGNQAISCNPLDDGSAAYGIVFTNGETPEASSYSCVYTIPVKS